MMSRRFLRFDAIAFTGVPGLTYGKGHNRNRYLLASAPAAGEHVGWGESNAVVYANSCLGA